MWATAAEAAEPEEGPEAPKTEETETDAEEEQTPKPATAQTLRIHEYVEVELTWVQFIVA